MRIEVFKTNSNSTPWRTQLVDAYPFSNIMVAQLQHGQLIREQNVLSGLAGENIMQNCNL